MYEAGHCRSLAIRKSPSMPALIVGGDGAAQPEKMLYRSKTFRRKVQSTISLCAGMLLITVALFILCTLDPSKVSNSSEPWRFNAAGPRILITLPHRPWRALHTSSYVVVNSQPSRLQGQPQGRIHVREDGAALEGMGALFRRGRRLMTELVVAHLSETTTVEDLRLFLRGLHRSGMPARADVVLLFPWRPVPLEMGEVIHEEEQYFQSLLAKHKRRNQPGARKPASAILSETTLSRLLVGQDSRLSLFNSAAYLRPPPADAAKGRQESIWGSTHHGNKSATDTDAKVSDGELNFGALVGFDMQELDPNDALSGFMDAPPANLRRWVCYQILLGMVRQRYRHVFLTEVTGVFILKDVLAPLKKKDTGLYLFYPGHRWADADLDQDHTKTTMMIMEFNSSTGTEHEGRLGAAQEGLISDESTLVDSGQDNSRSRSLKAISDVSMGIMESVYGQEFWGALEKEDKVRKVISTGVMMGGIRPVRCVASAMATEIVRVALLRKSRSTFKDEALLSYLVHKSSVLGRKVASHLQIHDSGESSINLLPGPPRPHPFDDFSRPNGGRFAVIQGLMNKSVADERRTRIIELLRDDICQSQRDPRVYPDCFPVDRNP